MSGTQPQTPTPSDSTLPPAIRRQRDAANALIEQARQGNVPPAPPENPGIQTLVPQEQAPEPPRNAQHPEQNPPQDGQPAQQAPQGEDWEHKYKSLEGRHRAEMARQQAQIDNMRDLMATLQTPPPAAQPSSTAPVETFRSGPDDELTEDERRDYGPDLEKFVRKIAKQAAYDVAGKLRPDIEKVQQHLGRVTEVAARTAESTFYEDLDRSVPDWRDLNTNAEFLDWLKKRDAYSGVPRMDLLNAAVNEKSAPRAAAFFEGYKREQTTVSPQGQQPAAPSPAAAPGNGRVPLESLAAPGRAKPGGAGTPQDKPVYSRAQITQFYDDIRRGKYKGREAEMTRIEADIYAAQSEGRIT